TPATAVWYSSATSTTPLLATDALADGNYYATIIDAVTGCESATRLVVAVNVNDPGTPTTTSATQDFCLEDAPTVADITVTPATAVWYSSATSTTPLLATDALADGNYYATIIDAVTGCESAVRLVVAVNVNDPGTPTTTAATQDFCLEDAPTVADIAVSPATAVWYSSATSTTPLLATDALADGNYYATIIDAVTGCESATRLVVAVNVNDPGTPTTTSATQDFCLKDAPTVADIAVTPATAVWYSSATST
ncbi:hypothetical protein GON26_21485, partial [Flavobacterium sp. GA093]|nr:hypothetical protein [Flavobacterium hydrocarbonoxydans]